MRTRWAAVFSIMAMTAAAAGADTVSLAQLDASRLLVSQNVDAYVSVTDAAGEPVQGLPLAGVSPRLLIPLLLAIALFWLLTWRCCRPASGTP